MRSSGCCWNQRCLIKDTIIDFAAILFPLIDLVCDIYTAVQYYKSNNILESHCIWISIIIAVLINSIIYFYMSKTSENGEFSLQESTIFRWLRWPYNKIIHRFPAIQKEGDQNNNSKPDQENSAGFRWLCDISFWLGLSTVIYPLHVMKYRMKIWKEKNEKRVVDYITRINQLKSDGSLLNLLEFALEAGPQFVLKCSFLLNNIDKPSVFDYVTTLSSAVFMGLSLALYQRAVRLAQDKNTISWVGTGCLWSGHFLLLLSHGLSLSLVAHLFPGWTTLAYFGHVVIATYWIYCYDRTHFCKNEIGLFMFSLILGAVYVFTFLQVVEKPTRTRSTVYYFIRLVETVICCGVWCLNVNDVIRSKLAYYVLIPIVLLYVLGIIIIILYYICLHPTRNNRGMTFQTDTIPLNEQLHLTDQQSDLSKPKDLKVHDTDHQ